MNKEKKTAVVIVVVAIVLGALMLLAGRNGDSPNGGAANNQAPTNPVEIVDGKQIITITAKGGYSPSRVTAQANMPTVLRVQTQSTYDCSSAFTIPSMNVSKFLPATGVTEFEIPAQEAGKELQAMCSMGMYGLSIRFE